VSGVWVHDLRDADASCGGKAVGLAKLIAAGVPVPEGFAIDAGAFGAVAGQLPHEIAGVGHALEEAARRIASAELPVDFVAEVERRAAELGPLLAVRSSATIEDSAAGAAAGVFSSRRAVPLGELWDAIRAVWTSALTPLAAAYARGRPYAIGVIVQRFVEGELITIYSRPPGEPTKDELLVQRGGRLERKPRAGIALQAELAIGATDGADVELVDDRWIVQARPIIHPQPRALVPPPPAVLACLQDSRVWTWDVAHNPDPLSPAQQGLVERVERAGIAALRVCAGYLYYSALPAKPVDTRDLAVRAAELEARLERTLDEAHPPSSVADAIERYLAFYALWAGELAPLIAAVPRTQGSRPSSIEAVLAAAARGELAESDAIDQLGALAPAWDVAVATYGERPGLIRDAIARAASIPQHSAPPRVTDLAADLAERDDRLFARAQRLVRRALLAHAGAIGDDIFWLPLDEVVSGAALEPIDARRRANAARAAAARAAGWQMPLVVGGSPTSPREALRGVGTGPRVTGRVRRFASLASAIAVGHGDVVVARAVTPALAVLVVGCAAIVSETGNLLDHGAALARELGIPCVVDCHDAWSQLADGMIVTVDGDGGTVSRP
jgi:phosphohistidine swiveling domain-containing protein